MMNSIVELAKNLYLLAKERNNQYPLKFYNNRRLFDYKLEELFKLAMKESKRIKINKEIVSICNDFRNNPVFICGYFKSGTSLLNSLLDYHPEMICLLPDSRILFQVRENAQKLSKSDYFSYLSHWYLKRLYNPTGHFPMNLYSDSFKKLDIKNYASFIAYLSYFIDKAYGEAALLSALPCAIFATNGQFKRGDRPKLWVEKTAINIKHIKLAQKIFPQCKFLYIIRDPYDNLASLKRWYA